MKLKLIAAAVMAVTAFSSCSMTSKTKTVKTMDVINTGIYANPVVVDLEVSETKVSGTASGTAGSAALISNIKQNAVADALKSVNADVLVEPVFEVVSSGGKASVTVWGYPATYKNFRTVKMEDLPQAENEYSKILKLYDGPDASLLIEIPEK